MHPNGKNSKIHDFPKKKKNDLFASSDRFYNTVDIATESNQFKNRFTIFPV